MNIIEEQGKSDEKQVESDERFGSQRLRFWFEIVLSKLIERKHELGLDSVWTIDGMIKFKFLRNEFT